MNVAARLNGAERSVLPLSPKGEAALGYAARGWHVFPCAPGLKIPHVGLPRRPKGEGGYKFATDDTAQIIAWWTRWPDANIGLGCAASGIVVADVDSYKPDCAWPAFAKGVEVPDTLVQRSARGGTHYFFAAGAGEAYSKPCNGVDAKHDGYVMLEPSEAEGGIYYFETDDEPAPAPSWLKACLADDYDAAPKAKPKIVNPNDLARVRRRLEETENVLDRDQWVKLALALKTSFGDAIRGDFVEFSYRYDGPVENGDPERVWDTAQPNGRVGIGTIFFLLGGGADLTEDGVALAFTARFGDSLRYDHDAGAWFEWTGDHWRQDGTGLAFGWCRDIARELGDGADSKINAIVRKASFAGGVERLARTDRAHAVTQNAWDGDRFLLGVPGGMVDLRTGKLVPADPIKGITKHAAVAPSERADCPQWLSFLKEATGSDDGMVEFLKRWCGYCLTGDTREHALIFLYGPGGNGKSVFLNTVSRIMGNYAATAAMDTFTATKSSQHLTFVAMLRGARLVTASETEEGRAWAEARIKQMTGGDPITANFMRCDPFTFTPQFKLTIVGNHAPALANVDEAAKRRFNIVPFTVQPANPDRELEAKLVAEWPAILRWMVDGAVAWQRGGLERPARVKAATAEYFSEQDLTAQWLADACTVEVGASHHWETASALFESWSHYARSNGEDPGTAKAFAPRLRRHGLRQVKKSKGLRAWEGVSINRAEAFPDDA